MPCQSSRGGSCLAHAPVELCVNVFEAVECGHRVMDYVQLKVIEAGSWGKIIILI